MSRFAAVFAAGLAVLLIPAAEASRVAERVPRYGIFEYSFQWPSSSYSNPWEQVSLRFTAISPSGRRTTVGGFYFGRDTWKVRFAPAQPGRWRWNATLFDVAPRKSWQGAFIVGRKGRGFVRRSPYNRFRWVFADGSPYYPIGIQDCILDRDRSGSPFDTFYVDDTSGPLSFDRYLATYEAAGVNLFRWGSDNCAFSLFQTIAPDGNSYREREGHWADEVVRSLRSHGFRIYMTLFGNKLPFRDSPTSAQIDAIKRYVKYVVDRYGAYVDYWELMNEATVSTVWYTQIGQYLRSIDPYHHPIATSWERPDLAVIDVNAPHWYETESDSVSDSRTWSQFAAWKAAGKPVIVGEQGNSGRNWDEQSALRMRLRAWTAFFAEGTLIFWNTSDTRQYRSVAANMYLGAEERRYLRVLHDFTREFDPRARIVPVAITTPGVRGYGLSGPKEYAAYLHAFDNHATASNGARLTIRVPKTGSALWIDPSSGRTVARLVIRRGTRHLAVPPFDIDMALKIRFRRDRR